VSGRFSTPETPRRLPLPKTRRRQRDAQPVPNSPDVFPWRANEIVIGQPRARRGKAQEPCNE
jgi:hypothetical protein